jgi:hypothetical protein
MKYQYASLKRGHKVMQVSQFQDGPDLLICVMVEGILENICHVAAKTTK